MRINITLISLCIILMFSGCTKIMPTPYTIEIPQGNLLTLAQMNQIKLGMSRREVQRLLGSPLLVDTFHQQRWDYFYSLAQHGNDGIDIKHHASIWFSNNQVSEIIIHKTP